MSEGLNKVFLLGNLCADPELKMFQGGSVLKMRLACTDSYWDRNSNTRKEQTEFVNVCLFGKRGEALARFLEKGARIFVEGGLRTSSWTADDGKKRYRTEVVASNVILNGRRDSSGRHVTHESPSELETPDPAEDFGAYQGGDDDVPF